VNINEYTIEVNGLIIKVVRKDIKNTHLAVYPPNGWIRIAVPNIIDDEAVRLAVISKLGWIKKHQKSFSEQPRQSVRELITRESPYFLGRRYLLDIEYDPGKPRVVQKNKKVICLFINQNSTPEFREELLNKWYRSEMKKILSDIIKKWEMKTGLKVSQHGIRKMKTKWGSCNPSAKRIWLNLDLIKKPLHCIEYIVVHEIHFLERGHNNAFISHLTRFMPQWRTFKSDLNRFSQ
jgi:predicted metal-dependent hydrolase